MKKTSLKILLAIIMIAGMVYSGFLGKVKEVKAEYKDEIEILGQDGISTNLTGDGYSWDYQKRVLTLDNFSYEKSDNKWLIYIALKNETKDTVTIKFKGDNTFSISREEAIQWFYSDEGDTLIFEGEKKATLSMNIKNSSGNTFGLYSEKGDVIFKRGTVNFNVESTSICAGLYVNYGHVLVEGGNLNIKCSTTSSSSAVYGFSGRNVEIKNPANLSFSATGSSSCYLYDKAATFTINKDDFDFDVPLASSVAEINITSKNKEKGIKEIYDFASEDFQKKHAIEKEEVGVYCSLNIKNEGSPIACAMYSNGDEEGEALGLEYISDEAYYLCADGSEKGFEIEAEDGYAIKSVKINLCGVDYVSGEKFVFYSGFDNYYRKYDGTVDESTMGKDRGTVVCINDSQTDEKLVSDYEDASETWTATEGANVKSISISNDSYFVTRISSIEVTYEKAFYLYIGGVAVTTGNCDDVLGDGRVSYDAEKDMISFNDDIEYTGKDTFIISTSDDDNRKIKIEIDSDCENIKIDSYSFVSHACFDITAADDVKIELNRCFSTTTATVGILTEGKLTIKSDCPGGPIFQNTTNIEAKKGIIVDMQKGGWLNTGEITLKSDEKIDLYISSFAPGVYGATIETKKDFNITNSAYGYTLQGCKVTAGENINVNSVTETDGTIFANAVELHAGKQINITTINSYIADLKIAEADTVNISGSRKGNLICDDTVKIKAKQAFISNSENIAIANGIIFVANEPGFIILEGDTAAEYKITKYVAEDTAVINSTAHAIGLVPHTHYYSDTYSSDETDHYYICECGDKKDSDAHSYVWVTDTAATTEAAGSKHEECSVCGYKKAPVEIEKLEDTSKPGTEEPGDVITPAKELKSQKITTAKIKTIKAKTLKKKSVKIKLKAKTDGKGKLTYKITKCPKGMKKFIKISKKGVITLKKKAKKGTYKITITAAAKGDYKLTKKVIKIKVK